MRRLIRFLDPCQESGLDTRRWIALIVVLLCVNLLTQAGALGRLGGYFGYGGYPYAPPASEFGILDTCGTVHSAYSYESGLIDWQIPVDDVDYMLCWQDWTSKGLIPSEPVKLPGTRWDRYTINVVQYIYGSGWAVTIMAPNGGAFALLHLRSVLVHAGQTVTGQTYVGWSGWPTDPFYGNGNGSYTNSHLCMVASAGSSDWFYRVDTGRDTPAPRPVYHPKPKPKFRFEWSIWNRWTQAHHRKSISPKYRGHWSWPASYWSSKRRYRWMGGVVDAGHWYRPTRGRRFGFTKQKFGRSDLYMWPKLHRAKAVRVKQR